MEFVIGLDGDEGPVPRVEGHPPEPAGTALTSLSKLALDGVEELAPVMSTLRRGLAWDEILKVTDRRLQARVRI